MSILDDHAGAIMLRVPSNKVVLLQAFFELSEGLGAVRTYNVRENKVLILLARDSYPDALDLLNSIKDLVEWEFLDEPVPELD
jgi:hypothetical protein